MATENFATFEPRLVQWVRLTVVESTKSKRGVKYVVISDISIYTVKSIPASAPNGGRWNITLNFPIVPVTAFVNPTKDEVITLSSYLPNSFSNYEDYGSTCSATWNLKNGAITEEILNNSTHDMFCPGTSFDQCGQVLVTGGSSPYAVSIFNPKPNTWITPKDETKENDDSRLQIPRGYAGQTFLPNGKTFVIGGAWGRAGTLTTEKDGEVFDPKTGGWEVLENVRAEFIKMDKVVACDDPKNKGCEMTEWQQHHPWLFAWKNGSIFHGGPSKKMNWFYTTPAKKGTQKDAGFRKDSGTANFTDGDAVCGVTSMYDAEAGLILTAGGAPNYHYWLNTNNQTKSDLHRQEATNNTFEIELGNPGETVNVTKVESMTYNRIFANAVILPNGETLVIGGQAQGEPFWEPTWQPVPEIYSPKSKTWRPVARHSTPRVYHSWALLLPNAAVLVGGGGLNRPETNRYDAQIYEPPYLFEANSTTLAKQPAINSIDGKLYKTGDNITITTDVAVDAASLIRYSAITHTVNNDIRRIKLAVQPVNDHDLTYTMKIPEDSGVTLPGYWMLFVLANGVPSHAKTVQILDKQPNRLECPA
jgi:galactose oxidase